MMDVEHWQWVVKRLPASRNRAAAVATAWTGPFDASPRDRRQVGLAAKLAASERIGREKLSKTRNLTTSRAQGPLDSAVDNMMVPVPNIFRGGSRRSRAKCSASHHITTAREWRGMEGLRFQRPLFQVDASFSGAVVGANSRQKLPLPLPLSTATAATGLPDLLPLRPALNFI